MHCAALDSKCTTQHRNWKNPWLVLSYYHAAKFFIDYRLHIEPHETTLHRTPQVAYTLLCVGLYSFRRKKEDGQTNRDVPTNTICRPRRLSTRIVGLFWANDEVAYSWHKIMQPHFPVCLSLDSLPVQISLCVHGIDPQHTCNAVFCNGTDATGLHWEFGDTAPYAYSYLVHGSL